jgi:hypothetical protein
MTATLKALRALIEEQRDADASPSLARVMAVLQAINGRKLTKREHAAIHDAAAVALRIGPDGTGWTIQTADHGTSIHGWRIRLSWQTTVCPVVDVDAIRRENPSYFSGAQDRNAIRAGWLDDSGRLDALASAVETYREAAAALSALVEHPNPDGWLIRKRFADADSRAFKQTIESLNS